VRKTSSIPGLILGTLLALGISLQCRAETPPLSTAVFNVRDFGATGLKSDDARPAIQKAVDACTAAGGGEVYFPSGDYTSATIFLRSDVRVVIEAGATLFASRDPAAYAKDTLALLYGRDLEHITIEGRGTIDGQAEYEWRLNDIDDAYIKDNQLLMEAAGKPTLRSFPKSGNATPNMFLLVRCVDVRIAGLSVVRSPSWTMHPVECRHLVIDGLYIHTSLEEGVWADGIDPDGCRDVRISNCTIETGDDAIVFYSMDWYGPAQPCEDITVMNCRLSSASSAIKFCDGNKNCVRHVTISNCIITDSNRGIAFMTFDGGYVSDVVISGLTIDCRRHQWFWWGDGDPIHFNIKRRSEIMGRPAAPGEPPAGAIRNVKLQNIIARGRGSSLINGHPDSWLDNVTLENITLYLSNDPQAQVQKVRNAFEFRWARNLKLRDVEVFWNKPESERWESAFSFRDVSGLTLDDVSARQARLGSAAGALVFDQVEDAVVRRSKAQKGTSVFLEVKGDGSKRIYLLGNDLREAAVEFQLGPGAAAGAVEAAENLKR
jgi:hypothetical protein